MSYSLLDNAKVKIPSKLHEVLAYLKTCFLIGPRATLNIIKAVYKLRTQGVSLFLLDTHKLADEIEEDDLLS
jgi:hypothetical protein